MKLIGLQVDLAGELISVEFSVHFDPQALHFKTIEFNESLKDFHAEYNLTPGELTVALAGAQPITSLAELAQIQFEIAGQKDASQTIIKLNEIRLNEGMIAANLPNPLVSLNPAIPTTIALFQNYPNPFNPETGIRFQLSQPAAVILTLYDIQGHEVRQLIHDNRSAGRHSVFWDGRNETGRLVSSGVYFYRIEVRTDGRKGKSFVECKKMILMK